MPLREPVLNGDAGLSRKSSTIDSASYYYSITRLQTEGVITIDGKDSVVTGLSWLDREWSTSWDWFALQLSDGTDLMLYNIRKQDGSADETSSGTITFPGNRSERLYQSDFEIIVRDTWDSPKGGTYPSRWTVRLPERNLELDILPVIADQELFTMVRYWEGAVDIAGRHEGRPVHGRGYVELTGYAE